MALKWKKGTAAKAEERKSVQGQTSENTSPDSKKPKSPFANLKSKLKKVEDDPPKAKTELKPKADLKAIGKVKSEINRDPPKVMVSSKKLKFFIYIFFNLKNANHTKTTSRKRQGLKIQKVLR